MRCGRAQFPIRIAVAIKQRRHAEDICEEVYAIRYGANVLAGRRGENEGTEWMWVIRKYQETAGPLQDHTPESPVQKQTGRPGFCQTPRDHIGG
jgi:hypothetical protein